MKYLKSSQNRYLENYDVCSAKEKKTMHMGLLVYVLSFVMSYSILTKDPKSLFSLFLC